MNKRQKTLKRIKAIIDIVDSLESSKIHELYWDYDVNLHNLRHNTLILATKGLGLINRRKAIDHCCHISRFYKDVTQKAKVFEATVKDGMIENDLIEKLKIFQGKVYIRTLRKDVNKERARRFEYKYRGIIYLKKGALFAGLDIPIVDRIFKNTTSGGFCSWLMTKFLKNQDIKIKLNNGNAKETTPADLYHRDKNVKLFYKYEA